MKSLNTPYFAFFKMTFKQNTVYRVEWLFGILSSVLQIFVSVAIWKTLYGSRDAVNGINFSVIVTNFIISLGLSEIFSTNDFTIQQKINDGSIANELLKPIDYRKILLAQTLAQIVFKFLSNFLPTLIITSIIFGILPPVSLQNFLIYLVSMFLGFCVLWSISLIIQMTAFWIINVWSISTIKNVFVKVLAGTMLPLYFMPEPVLKIIAFTPFDSIYHIPLQIYLGTVDYYTILFSMLKQIVWIAILYSVSLYMWHRGSKKLVIQGG
ncbi:MAG: ABC-2 family transporter protein [Treponema sp.]|nr:ABC-2 family transporter protein [Treponema sp.]